MLTPINQPTPCDSMSLLNLCFCTCLMLSLFRFSHQSCMVGTANQCKNAELAPGTNLAGEGFDITQMARKGAFVIDMNQWQRKDKTCTLCVNPYLEGRKQKLPLSAQDWRPNQSCMRKVSSSIYRSSASLISSSTSSLEDSWKTDLDINVGTKGASLILAGTQSKLAKYSKEKTKSDKFSFTSHGMTCEHYSYRVSNIPKLHQEFRAALNNLPKTYSAKYKQQYYRLIDKFGTHFITKVKLGGSVQSVTSIRQCQASLEGISMDDVQICLNVEASATMGQSSVKSEVHHCQQDVQKSESKSSFSSHFNDRFTEIKGGQTTEPELLFSADKNPSAYREWLKSLPQYPDIVSYSLESLHELLPAKNPTRKNLRSAISHYILEKALWKNCSEPCQAGMKRNPKEPCKCSCHDEPAVNQDCCPVRKGMARVVVTVQRASDLWGDTTTSTDGFVKVSFEGQPVRQSPVINNNNNPHWNMVVNMGTLDLSLGSTVRFEVWDQDNNWDDDLLGECEKALTAGVKEDLCNLQHGQLYYKWEVTCAPSLGGDTCMNYRPSPISQDLQKVYVSRHTLPVPEAILKEKGVFLGVPQGPQQSEP